MLKSLSAPWHAEVPGSGVPWWGTQKDTAQEEQEGARREVRGRNSNLSRVP